MEKLVLALIINSRRRVPPSGEVHSLRYQSATMSGTQQAVGNNSQFFQIVNFGGEFSRP
jgi:hypothetical protein